MHQLPENWSVRTHELHCDDVPLSTIAAHYGTPVYLYSATHLRTQYGRLDAMLGAVPHRICYSVKANSNLSLMHLLRGLGAGFDIVSGGELERALAAGATGKDIVFSGVGKRKDEMQEALKAGIKCFNVESTAELEALNDVAVAMGARARVAVRINPNVDPKTHPYISTGLKENKFGVPHAEIVALYKRMAAMPGILPVGLDCHIGSQLLDLSPMLEALDRVLELYDALAAAGIAIEHIDLGGGFGIQYKSDQTAPDLAAYGNALAQRLGARKVEIVIEPGRSIVGNAGALLTQVMYLKETEAKTFAIVDAAMTDLIRPALYGAYQRILPVRNPERVAEQSGRVQIVGPVCESADFLGKDRDIDGLQAQDLLCVLSSGAYGFVMASQYNTRPMVAEVMVDGSSHRLIRRRQTVDELLSYERDLLPK